MGGACSTYEGDVQIGFWWGNLKERSHLEGASVNGRIILSSTFRKVRWCMEWTDLAEDRGNIRVP